MYDAVVTVTGGGLIGAAADVFSGDDVPVATTNCGLSSPLLGSPGSSLPVTVGGTG